MNDLIASGQSPRMRYEDDRSNNGRTHRGDQNRAGCYILGHTSQWMKLRRGKIRQQFQSGVQCLGCPNCREAQNETTPLQSIDSKNNASRANE